MTTRARDFDTLVLEAADRLSLALGSRFADTEFAVEEVPPLDPLPWEESITLGRLFPPHGRIPARIVLYRRPIESRGLDESERAALIADVVAEHVAALLGVGPEDLPPMSGHDAR
jgi:predicted Zn-dependent protease with MMP-like domain